MDFEINPFLWNNHLVFPNHVCKLHQALYDVKQAICAWFDHLSSFLLDFQI